MKKWILASLILVCASTSLAQKIKVRRVKGNQAVIEYSGGILQPGQAYELAHDEFSEPSSSSGSRQYVVGLDFSLLSTKSDASGAESVTEVTLGGKFGWNFVSYEIGPLVKWTSSTTGSATSSTFRVGGFADYNMIHNMAGEAFIYGLGGSASMGQQDVGGNKKDLMTFFAGPFAKWFPTGGSVGFRTDLGYIYQRQSGGSSGDVAVSGLSWEAGILAYF
ncbi:MAG: hypothetical protein AAGB31_05165 [Bdellovibrio sp.]